MKLNEYPLWTALITPFTPGLKVDYSSLEKIVREQEAAGNALLVLGSTGEALNLDLETRKKIVQFVISLKPKTPIMVGVGGHQLSAQQAWTAWLETQSIDAYLMVTPIYAKPGDQGQFEWFKTLMDGVSKPVMLYNVPSRAGKALSYEAVRKLNTHPNFWGIKEASGSVAIMKDYLSAANGGLVYCGDDALLPEFVAAGAVGLVSVASNTWPQETNLYIHQNLNQKFDAKELWMNAANSLFVASNPIPAKALLATEGRINHNTMMPPLAAADLKDLSTVLQSSTKIRNWYQDQK